MVEKKWPRATVRRPMRNAPALRQIDARPAERVSERRSSSRPVGVRAMKTPRVQREREESDADDEEAHEGGVGMRGADERQRRAREEQ